MRPFSSLNISGEMTILELASNCGRSILTGGGRTAAENKKCCLELIDAAQSLTLGTINGEIRINTFHRCVAHYCHRWALYVIPANSINLDLIGGICSQLYQSNISLGNNQSQYRLLEDSLWKCIHSQLIRFNVILNDRPVQEHTGGIRQTLQVLHMTGFQRDRTQSTEQVQTYLFL